MITLPKRRVPLGKAIRWFPDDETEADRLALEMATPTPEDIELAKASVKDRTLKALLEATLKEDDVITNG